MYVIVTNKESLSMSEMRGVRASLLAILGIVVALVIVGLPLVEAQRQYDASLYSGLRWRMIGPFRGGRVNGVTGVPGQPDTFYFGSVGGGVWKSNNSGRTWAPIDRKSTRLNSSH